MKSSDIIILGIGVGILYYLYSRSSLAPPQIPPLKPPPSPPSLSDSRNVFDYIIFNDNDVIKAQNGQTGKIDYSGNASAVIQDAIDNTTSGTIFVVPGYYVINNQIILKKYVTLKGTTGTVFIVNYSIGDDTKSGMILMQSNTRLQGIEFYNMGQSMAGSVDVKKHPYVIETSSASYITIDDIILNAVWKGIALGKSTPVEAAVINNIRGTVLKTGIFVDKNTDTVKISNIHFNPNFWVYDDTTVDTSVLQNYMRNTSQLENFVFARCDDIEVVNVLTYGGLYGMHFVKGATGNTSGAFSNIALDGCKYCVQVSDAHMLLFSNTYLASTQLVDGEVNKDIVIPATGAYVIFDNSSFFGNTVDKIVDMTAESTLMLSNVRISDYVTGIYATAGNVVLSNVIFQAGAYTDYLHLTGTAKATTTNVRTSDNHDIGYYSNPYNNDISIHAAGMVYAPSFLSYWGQSQLVASTATSNKYFTLPKGDGMYLIMAGQDASVDGGLYNISFVRTGSSSGTLFTIAKNGLSLVLSGFDVKVVNNSTVGSAWIEVKAIRIGND